MTLERTQFLCQQTYAALFALANKLQVVGDMYLSPQTSRQLMTVLAIAHIPEGQASLSRIAGKMGTTKQNARQLVSALEAKGHVRVESSLSDRRSYAVQITDHGYQVFKEALVRGMPFLDEIFHDFSDDELETLWALLKKLYRFDGKTHDGFEEP